MCSGRSYWVSLAFIFVSDMAVRPLQAYAWLVTLAFLFEFQRSPGRFSSRFNPAAIMRVIAGLYWPHDVTKGRFGKRRGVIFFRVVSSEHAVQDLACHKRAARASAVDTRRRQAYGLCGIRLKPAFPANID